MVIFSSGHWMVHKENDYRAETDPEEPTDGLHSGPALAERR